VKSLRRFFDQKIRPMPKQSLMAMKVAFGIRAQYTTIAFISLLFVSQLIGVAIFSGKAKAVGDITYASKITSQTGGGFGMSFDKDSAGNVYVAGANNYVYKYNPSGGLIARWGGSGTGNGQFGASSPTRVAVDASDNVYVMDTANNRIQKFNSSGVYQSQFGSSGTGDGQFNFAYGMGGGLDADAAGNMYVGDAGNHRIQKFNSSGVYQSQWGSSGSGSGEFTYINDVGVSPAGDIYVTEGTGSVSGTNRTQKFNSSGVYQAEFAQSGTNRPQGIDFDASNNVYVADAAQDRFFIYNSSGTYLSSIRNTITGGVTYDVVLDGSGNYYTADSEGGFGSPARFIKKIDGSGTTLLTFANSANGAIDKAAAVAVGPDGSLYVASRGNNRIQKYTSSGAFDLMFGMPGTGNGQFQQPTAVAVSNTGKVYVVDTSNNRVQRFASDGTFETKWGTQGSADSQIDGALGIAVDPSGDVYVADSGNARIVKYDADGNYLTKWTPQMPDSANPFPTGVAADRYGNIYVADPISSKVGKFDQSGNLRLAWGGYGYNDTQMQYPYGVGVDPAGRVFVTQGFFGGMYQVKKFAADGTYIAAFGYPGSGDGEFDFSDNSYQNAGGVAISNDGKVYVADTNNNRVQVFDDNSFDLRLTTEAAYNTTSSSTIFKLHSTDNPNLKNATYSFEYGQSDSYGTTATATTTGLSPVRSVTLSNTGYSGSVDPTASVRDSQGNYYVQGANCKVQKFSSNGTFLLTIGSSCGSNMPDRFGSFPRPGAVDSNDNVYIYQGDSQYILKYDSDGNLLGNIDTGAVSTNGVADIAIDPSDNVYVSLLYSDSNSTGGTVAKYDANGALLDQIGSHGTGDGQFSATSGPRIALDDAGNLYTLDNYPSSRIQKFDTDGNFTASWSATNLDKIAVDRAHHILYATGTATDRITMYRLDGTSLGYQDITPSADQGIMSLIGSDYSVTGISSTTFNDYLREATVGISGFDCGTTYHYRAKAQVGSETVYGADQTFTTTACAQPISITTTSLPDGQVNASYTQVIATNATDPVVTLVDGDLPPGLTLDPSGLLSGYPTTAGTYNFTLRAASNTPEFTGTDDQAYTVTIMPQQISMGACDADFLTGYPVNYTITTDDGFGYPTFEVVSGSLPAGLTMDGAGTITGTPTTLGVGTVHVRVSDLTGSDERDCIMRVFKGSPNLNTSLMSISSPSANTTLQEDRVTVTGKGPIGSTVAVYIDNYQVGTTTTDDGGNWSYQVTNIFPGTHTFDAKWLPVGKVVTTGTFATLDSPNQSAINLVDTGINKVVKRYFTEQVPSISYGFAISNQYHKAYMITAQEANTPSGVIANLTEVDLETGKNTNLIEDIQTNSSLPVSLTMADDSTLYMLTSDKVVTYKIGQKLLQQASLPADTFAGEMSFASIVVNSDQTKLYVVYSLWSDNDNNRTRRIAVVDLTDNSVNINNYGPDGLLNRIQLGNHYAEIIGTELYAVYSDGKILVYDTTSDTVEKTIDMNLTNTNAPNDFEQIYGASIDRQNMLMYVTVVHQDAQTYRISKVNLDDDSVSTLLNASGSDFVYPYSVYDPFTQKLYIQDTAPNSNFFRTSLRQFNLSTNLYVEGNGNPVIDGNPGAANYGFGDNAIFSPSSPFVASVTYTYNLPPVEPPKSDPPKPPSVDSNPEPPTVDVTPPASTTKPGGSQSSRIKTPNKPAASSNSLLALVARLPQSIVVGFPWLLLLLALILVGTQYYQVHSEQLATVKMKQSVAKQQQLVDEQNNFVALTTHYLHTPLTVMEGEISLMVKAGTITEAQATKLRAALASLNSETEQILSKEDHKDKTV